MNGNSRWPLERVLFALAGTVTLLSAAGACPASIILRPACRLRSAIYEDGAAAKEVAL